MFTIHGYIDGVTYATVVDPDTKPGHDGLVVDSSPGDPIDILRAYDGHPARLHAVGQTIPVSLTTVDGIIAGLREFTDVTHISGDYTEPVPDDDVIH